MPVLGISVEVNGPGKRPCIRGVQLNGTQSRPGTATEFELRSSQEGESEQVFELSRALASYLRAHAVDVACMKVAAPTPQASRRAASATRARIEGGAIVALREATAATVLITDIKDACKVLGINKEQCETDAKLLSKFKESAIAALVALH